MKNYEEIIFGDSPGILSHLLMFRHLRSTPVADYRLTTGAAHFISFEDDNKRHYHLALGVTRKAWRVDSANTRIRRQKAYRWSVINIAALTSLPPLIEMLILRTHCLYLIYASERVGRDLRTRLPRTAKEKNVERMRRYIERRKDRKCDVQPMFPYPEHRRIGLRGCSRAVFRNSRRTTAAADNTVNMFTNVHFSRLNITFVFFIRPFL